MKLLLILLVPCSIATAQSTSSIDRTISRSVVESHIRFLASDELGGRGNNSAEAKIASQFIAQQFQAFGVSPAVDGSFFQEVPLITTHPAGSGWLQIDEVVFQSQDSLMLLETRPFDGTEKVIFAGYGSESEIETLPIEGRIVFSKLGSRPDQVGGFYQESLAKRQRIKEKGGLGLVELYDMSDDYWKRLGPYLRMPKHTLDLDQDPGSIIPSAWIRDPKAYIESMVSQSDQVISWFIPPPKEEHWSARNVIGVIPGSDPKLKNEFVLLTAHYDHLGVGLPVNGDSIYNGARDNAIGVAAILGAAQYFGIHPPRRSVLVMAVSAEELGILGSQWYVLQPVRPLNRTVFNLNSDGAGYNDISKITVIGLDRTSAESAIRQGCQAYNLEPIADPAPEQNLFDRSDNVHFARAGVPAVDFAPGMTAFDQEIGKYYHQPADEAASLDFEYVHKFVKAYIHCAIGIANSDLAPTWRKGDKYEDAGLNLYSR